MNNIVEGVIPVGWEESPPDGNYLKFELVGALITRSRNESKGNHCIVIARDDGYYEVHRIQKEEGK